MRQFTISILVDEDNLLQTYQEGHSVSEEDCPPIEDMILFELHWVVPSGISIIGELLEDPNGYHTRSL